MSDLYSRQRNMNIDRDLSICVVGCGGVGMNVVMMLAMAGVEEIIIFDDDIIEEHNLNRMPVPYKAMGMNKAHVGKEMIRAMRPNLNVSVFKTKFDSMLIDGALDWIIDCTDSFNAQQEISKFAKENSIKYCKLGYNGERISIYNDVSTWDVDPEDESGYTIIPSWAVPATIVASLGVAKVLKYEDMEMACEIKKMFIK